MFSCVQYTDAIRAEWDRFAHYKGTVFHTTAFRQILLSSFGYECAYHAILDKDSRICALMPLIAGCDLKLKRAGVSLPFVNYVDICAGNQKALQFALASFPSIMAKYRLDYIEIRLKEQVIDNSEWRAQSQNHTFVLPLADGEERVLALSTASNRNHVRKVYKNNWFMVSFDTVHLEDFYKVYVKRMKQLGSPAPDIRFFNYFFEYLPEHSNLLTVLDRETSDVVGGMLLLASPGNATLYYPYGANLVSYNRKYLNNFMYWEAVRFAIRSGMKYIDLGRSQIGSGTYKYKEQWGAKAEQLTYLVHGSGQDSSGPPERENLSFFVELWKVAPGFITDRVSRHLIKYLMP